ncbi:hypothetical protein K1719_040547 [Acacia pycnantha]|nr:hypothetical protein K1719_040547 [Acacia pycnantha]
MTFFASPNHSHQHRHTSVHQHLPTFVPPINPLSRLAERKSSHTRHGRIHYECSRAESYQAYYFQLGRHS